MDKFRNKYRIPSARASWWDYGNHAAYFITICTHNRVHHFGEIVPIHPSPNNFVANREYQLAKRFIQKELNLTPAGKVAEKFWAEIPHQFPYAALGAFVVMPNHIHGIIIINNPNKPHPPKPNGETTEFDGNGDTVVNANIVDDADIVDDANIVDNADIVETRLIASLRDETPDDNANNNGNKISGGITGDKNPMNHDNLSRIIRWYKGRCSFEIRKINPDFQWQSRFHDHIIRNPKEYTRIHHYIIANPLNWENDSFYQSDNPFTRK
ncbi:MAG: transposase [Chloroherpetonaceae bacterium]|nr:transposase [Chloroherpetonaceae bacterium]